jgi:dTDP-4-amino-4,6-dideoxygalactose transaminase
MPAVTEPVPFLDLSQEFDALREEWFAAIEVAGSTGQFILGPNVSAFEEEFAAAVGTRHAVALGNGTDALLLSLRALDIGPGDEVITTPYTFFATSEVITHTGAAPVFADILPDSFNLDPDSVRQRITTRTRAIIPVHLFGHPAHMHALMDIAREHDIAVIEDAAQAYGAEIDSQRVGSFGATGCFSFYPTKILGCYGDGGIVTTDNDEMAARLRHLRNHGATAPFMHDTAGYNSRLDEIQAALLRIKLRKVEDDIHARREVAALYGLLLGDTDIILPGQPDNGRHVFNLYTVRIKRRRDAVREHLARHKIPTSLCYPQPLHLQEVYKDLGYRQGNLPVSEQTSGEALSLPVYPHMPREHVERICDTLRDAL